MNYTFIFSSYTFIFLITVLGVLVGYLITKWKESYIKPNSEKERTLVILKPDCVQKNLIGSVINRFEKRLISVAAIRMFKLSITEAEVLYKEHIGKDFFDGYIKFMTSSPIVAVVLEGKNVIKRVREIIGNTVPSKAVKGTIRHDFGEELPRNVVHASDSEESANREINLMF